MSAVQAETKPDMLAAALDYAGRGWPVLPLRTPNDDGRCSCRKASCGNSSGKHPRIEHGLSDATTDEATIRRWWGQWPNANVGIRTGAVSGLVVLDVDARADGDLSLDELEAKHQKLPHTVEVLTGHPGGRHVFFQHPGGYVKGGAGRLGSGLDVKADGGLVVAPPSLHASGRRYEWEASSGPGLVPIATMPAGLLGLLRQAGGNGAGAVAPSSRFDVASVLAGVQEGDRDDKLTRYAASLRARGYCREEAEILVLEAARRCIPPFDEKTALGKVESAWCNIEPKATAAGRSPEETPLAPKVWRALDLYRANDLIMPEGLVAERHFVPKTVVDLFGPGGVGKTLALMKLFGLRALGLPFGPFALKPGASLLLSEEMDDIEMRARLLDLFTEAELEQMGNLFQVTCANGLDATTKEGRTTIRKIIEDHGSPSLVGIDGLSDIRGGWDENSNTEMGILFKGLRDEVARPLSICLAVIHHAGKNTDRKGADRSRGASIIRDICANVISLMPAKGDKVKWDWEKVRHGRKPPATIYAVLTGPTGTLEFAFGKPGDDRETRQTIKPRWLLVRDIVAAATAKTPENPTISAGTLIEKVMERFDLVDSSARDLISKTMEAGLIERKDRGLYGLPEDEDKE